MDDTYIWPPGGVAPFLDGDPGSAGIEGWGGLTGGTDFIINREYAI